MEDYQTEAIAAAVATGGYCFIGHGGTSIHWENETGGETRLSTWGDAVKAACIAAGVPTVDITMVLVEKCYGISVRGPLIAITKLDLARVGENPGALGYATLKTVADMWRSAGASVVNIRSEP
jgi:hypothetical protein